MRDSIEITEGSKILWRGVAHKITSIVSLDRVIATNLKTGESIGINIPEVEPFIDEDEASDSIPAINFEDISDESWEEAKNKYEIIRPLLELRTNRTLQDVEDVSKNQDVSVATLYRWIQSYLLTGKITSLLRTPRSDAGKTRFENNIDVLIEEVIEQHYLTMQKPNVSQAYEKLKLICKRNDIGLPSYTTFWRRIKEIQPKKLVGDRLGKALSNHLFDPAVGHYDEAKFPLSIVQIDHTPVDLMFVDDIERKSIGRAWITVAIDVYSRMVAGYYLSFENPSAASVGLCITQAICPKEAWLKENNIKSKWPIWGFMQNLHADNAKEFRSKMIDRVCLDYGIHMFWRPKGKTHYGGHIERLLGTFMKDIHTLPGTTFSNIQEKGKYKSETEAVFTISEFEHWLGTYICDVYHNKYHSGIGKTPLAKLEQGFLGDENTPGSGIPDRLNNQERLRLDFLPGHERTVQRYGIALDEIYYYHPSISHYVNAPDKESPTKKRKFLIKRDPRDISIVYFFDPELKDYLEIPYRNRGAPSMSLFELRSIRSHLKREGKATVDENMIFEGREKLHQIETAAVEKTKKQRRSSQRKKEAQKAIKKIQTAPVKVKEADIFNLSITSFDDLDMEL